MMDKSAKCDEVFTTIIGVDMVVAWKESHCCSHAFLILVGIDAASHPQTFFCRRRSYQADDDCQRYQGPAPPILAYVAEQVVLNLVPLGCPRREVGDVDLQPCLIGQELQGLLPELVPAAALLMPSFTYPSFSLAS